MKSRMERTANNGEWEELWEEYGPKLLLFARQQTEHASEAEDIVQEAFVRYWRARQKQPELSPTLLFTMVKRVSIDNARKARSRWQREIACYAGEDGEPVAWFADPVEEKERQQQLEAALRSIPPEQREVLVLKIWGGLTFEQIGETLSISPNTAASRYRYALNQLRNVITAGVI